MGSTSTGFAQGGGRNVKIAVPSARRAGDLLVVAESSNQANTLWATPKGWTAGGGGQLDGQDLHWWWKIASTSEPGHYTFGHSAWADGGIVMLDIRGLSSTPIRGSSPLGAYDNSGTGNVTSAACMAVSYTGASLLLVGWQSTPAVVTWPSGYASPASATDGFAHVVATIDPTSDPLSVENVQLAPGQAAVLSLQIGLG